MDAQEHRLQQWKQRASDSTEIHDHLFTSQVYRDRIQGDRESNLTQRDGRATRETSCDLFLILCLFISVEVGIVDLKCNEVQ